MADDHYRQDYAQHSRPEGTRSQPPSHQHPPPGDSPHQPASMAASVTLPSIHDSRAAPYGAQPPPAARGFGQDPRYTSPNSVNGYPPPHGQQSAGSYLPPLQPQPDARQPGYPPPDQRGGYYDDRRPASQYHEQYPPEAYYYRGPPQGPTPPNGYPRDYRGPPPGYGPEFGQMGQNAPPGMGQAAPRQRTSIACRYCRKRKIRCSGYQSAPGGKCQNCARMNQECIFQPVSSSSSAAFIPVSAVPGGVPPGTQLFGAYGQPLAPNSVPGHHGQYPPSGGPPPGNYYASMHSPTESFASYGDPRGEENALPPGRRRRRTSEEQDESYRLPPPRAGAPEDDRQRRSPAEMSNNSSPNGPAYAYQASRQSPRSQGQAQLAASHPSSAPGGVSPVGQNGSSGTSTPARQGASTAQPPKQQATSSVMSLSNLVDKNDIDKTMIDRLNRPRDTK